MICVFCILPSTALAVDSGRSYRLELTINGKNEVSARAGDVLTVTLALRRTDSDEQSEIYAVQDEIRYNAEFLELVGGSVIMQSGVETNDISLQGDERSLHVSYVSFGGGDLWESYTVLGSFQMRVLSDSGAAALTSENCSIPVPDGSDSYAVTTQDVTVVVSSDCRVTLDPQNSETPTVLAVPLGETLSVPKLPTWDGHDFRGWFRDKALSERWDFGSDTVQGNMTLYGGWTESGAEAEAGEAVPVHRARLSVCAAIFTLLVNIILLLFIFLRRKTVRFDSMGGSPVPAVRTWKGRVLPCPAAPHKDGSIFKGWYIDRSGTRPWNFARGRVQRNMTLYARWDKE